MTLANMIKTDLRLEEFWVEAKQRSAGNEQRVFQEIDNCCHDAKINVYFLP